MNIRVVAGVLQPKSGSGSKNCKGGRGRGFRGGASKGSAGTYIGTSDSYLSYFITTYAQCTQHLHPTIYTTSFKASTDQCLIDTGLFWQRSQFAVPIGPFLSYPITTYAQHTRHHHPTIHPTNCKETTDQCIMYTWLSWQRSRLCWQWWHWSPRRCRMSDAMVVKATQVACSRRVASAVPTPRKKLFSVSAYQCPCALHITVICVCVLV